MKLSTMLDIMRDDRARGTARPPPREEVASPSDPSLVAYIAQLAVTTAATPVDMRNAVFAAGYRQGVFDMIRRAAEMLPGELAKALRESERLRKALVEGAEIARVGAPGETPTDKSARVRRARREMRDNAQAAEFARLIQQGETTETARRKMNNMGDVRARRIRKLAVSLGLLERHQQTHKPSR